MGTSTFSEYTVVAEISVAKARCRQRTTDRCPPGERSGAAGQGVPAGLRHLHGLRRCPQHSQCALLPMQSRRVDRRR